MILQPSTGAIRYEGRKYLRKMVEAAAEEAAVSFALHLDHGADFGICKGCVDGVASVMIDGSRLPLEADVASRGG